MRKRVKPLLARNLLIAALSAWLPGVSWGYGADAHRIIGYVAETKLCEDTRVAVAELLDGQSLAEAGVWADKIRGNSDYDYAKPWHFINIPDGVAVADAERVKQGDILSGIAEMNRRLDNESLSKAEHADALRFLIHFIGDIHQPLHVGRYPDRGGNRIDVIYFIGMGKEPGKANLHSYWDTKALAIRKPEPEDYARRLSAAVFVDPAHWPGTPEEWAAEAMELRPQVYDFGEFAGAEGEPQYLSGSYFAQTMRTVDSQLMLAGMRLREVLNARYCAASKAAAPAEAGD